jgi:hypothetical protein
LGAGLALFGRVARSPDSVSSIIEVQALPGARWRRTHSGTLERLELLYGEALFKISRTSPAQKVRIVVPDGEIDDLGTILRVRVTEHTTERIVVYEGQVRVRLRGRRELTLVAGDTWVRESQMSLGATAAAASERPSTAAAASERPSTSDNAGARCKPNRPRTDSVVIGRQAPMKLKDEIVDSTSESSTTPPPSAEPPTPPPAETNEEDQLYLRMVTLLEEGQIARARIVADESWARFPKGFRRLEVSRVMREIGSLRGGF